MIDKRCVSADNEGRKHFSVSGGICMNKKIVSLFLVLAVMFTSVFCVSFLTFAKEPYRVEAEQKVVSIKDCEIKLQKSFVYTGKRIKPSVTVTYGEETLEESVHYTVKYQNNKQIGNALVTVTAIEESGFSGSKTVRFKIVPKKVTDLKVIKTTQTSVTLSWQKRGKNIRFLVSEYDRETGKYRPIKRLRTNSVKFNNLSPKSTHRYVVTAYKNVSGKNFYSPRSKVKARTLPVRYTESGRRLVDLDGQDWRLVVVNSTREFSRDYTPSVCYIMDSGTRLDERVAPYYIKMYRAAKKDGVTLTPYSGYRSYIHQEWNYNNLTSVYMNQYGLSRETAAKKAAETILPPGTSEHNLGLAMDICNTLNSFEKTKEFAWLMKNAQNYGFILRYPNGKQAVTGVIYEPWHWRFVGIKNAKLIKKSGLCLEEYLDANKIIY